MTETDYRTELKRVLLQEATPVSERMRSVLAGIPEAVQEIEIEVFPDQEGEGTFSVVVGAVGSDLLSLNNALGTSRVLLTVVHTSEGLTPPVPLVDPFESPFDARDVVVDLVAEWLRGLWDAIGRPRVGVPITIRGHDGFGTVTPIELKSDQWCESGDATSLKRPLTSPLQPALAPQPPPGPGAGPAPRERCGRW